MHPLGEQITRRLVACAFGCAEDLARGPGHCFVPLDQQPDHVLSLRHADVDTQWLAVLLGPGAGDDDSRARPSAASKRPVANIPTAIASTKTITETAPVASEMVPGPRQALELAEPR